MGDYWDIWFLVGKIWSLIPNSVILVLALGTVAFVAAFFMEETRNRILERIIHATTEGSLAFAMPFLTTVGRLLGRKYVAYPIVALVFAWGSHSLYSSGESERLTKAYNTTASTVLGSMAKVDENKCIVKIVPYDDADKVEHTVRVVSTSEGGENSFYIQAFQKPTGAGSLFGFRTEDSMFKNVYTETKEGWKHGWGENEAFAKRLLQKVADSQCIDMSESEEPEGSVKLIEIPSPVLPDVSSEGDSVEAKEGEEIDVDLASDEDSVLAKTKKKISGWIPRFGSE